MTTKILIGDALAQLEGLPDESVQCCVTSPPYYGLRCYDTEGQIGLEPTPEAHIARLVEVFREVRRVLRKDGVAWVNYGDAYYGSPAGTRGAHAKGEVGDGAYSRKWDSIEDKDPRRELDFGGAKPKDLLMLPARVALALQADGWWLRSMIPWLKRSAMPESATDRPATAVEYVFMLTKSARYFFDMEAVRQESITKDGRRPYGSDGAWQMDGRDKWAAGAGQMRATDATNRNFRNSDLFYSSLQEPHGLISDAEGNPLALDVNPAGFNDWTPTVKRIPVSYDSPEDGKRCTPSPDCPRHGDLIALVTRELCDERANGSLPDSDSIGARLVAKLTAGCGPTGQNHDSSTSQQSSDCWDQPCSPSATGHSKENRRTGRAPATNRPCTPSAGTPDRTVGKSASPALFEPNHDNAENNTAEGASDGNPSNRKSHHIADNEQEQASCGASSSPECICQWYIEKEEKTSHFATFPPKLIEPLIKAATSEKGCCPACAAPWVREVGIHDPEGRLGKGYHNHENDGQLGQRGVFSADGAPQKKTLGWSPSCGCKRTDGPASVPCVVLDPFGGAGTTGLVADRLGRDAILIELNPNYAEMARKRISGDAPLFAEVQT